MASTSAISIPKPPSTPPSASASQNRRRTPPLGRSARRRPPSFAIGSPPSQPYFSAAIPHSEIYGTNKDPFDFTAVRSALEELDGSSSEAAAAGSVSTRSEGDGHIRRRAKIKAENSAYRGRRRTGINSLPNELLLKIFSQVRDHYGFHPRTSGWAWYNPPTKLAIVCRRWLPVAQELFYRDVAVHHVGRIPLLYTALLKLNNVAVRSLDVRLPRIDDEAFSGASETSSGHAQDPDEDLGPDFEGNIAADDPSSPYGPSLSFKSKWDTYYASLRSMIHIVSPSIRRLSLAGVDLPLLFPPPAIPYNSPLAQMKARLFANLTHLSLTHNSTVGSQPASFADLREPLLALRGLKSLRVTGYRSDEGRPLDLSLCPTAQFSALRPRTIKLVKLTLVDCSISAPDLLTLVHHITPGSLEDLSIANLHSPRDLWAEDDVDEGFYSLPAVLHLRQILPILSSSLKSLRVGLYNYPLVGTSTPSIYSINASGPHGPPRPPALANAFIPQPWHIDPHLTQLDSLKALAIGGSACSAAVLESIPPSVHKLELISCETIGMKGTSEWVKALRRKQDAWGTPEVVQSPAGLSAPKRFSSAPSIRRRPLLPSMYVQARDLGTQWDTRPALKTLSILGSSGSTKAGGVMDHEARWELQRSCWEAGVTLKTGTERAGW